MNMTCLRCAMCHLASPTVREGSVPVSQRETVPQVLFPFGTLRFDQETADMVA